jgi:hypothetical protein
MATRMVYTPKDGDTQEWEFDLEDLTVGETKALERALNLTFLEIGNQFERGSVTVNFAFLWIFRRRTEPSLRIGDMDDISWSELKVTSDEPDGPAETAPKDSPPPE